MKSSNKLSLKTLTKSSAWGLQEADVFHLWQIAARDADLKDNRSHYLSVLRSAFDVEELTIDTPEVVQKYEDRGFKVAPVRMDENVQVKLAVKKKPIVRITDLTYENIRHISAAKLIEVLAGNFGGGWESLPQSVQDIIESGLISLRPRCPLRVSSALAVCIRKGRRRLRGIGSAQGWMDRGYLCQG